MGVGIIQPALKGLNNSFLISILFSDYDLISNPPHV